MPGHFDKNGHEWFTDEVDHPFLTGWKCHKCGTKTFTYDGHIPADEPKSDKPCVEKSE